MVSGGTYGTEDIVHGAGYGRAILILLLTPLLWSLPTAFMIGELSSALPFEGGYYAWVRRAMGNFWGFQEAWLSLVASIFDMAIYPTLFVLYLDRLFPWFQEGHRGLYVGMAVVVACALLNIAGVKVVSNTSLWLFFALSAPFASDRAASLRSSSEPSPSPPRRRTPTSAFSPACSSACGTTWDGTTPRPSRPKSRSRSTPIPAPCWSRSSSWPSATSSPSPPCG